MKPSKAVAQHVRTLVAIFVWFFLSVFNAQAEFPERPVDVIVPFGAGGSSDTFVRILQKAIRENDLLPQPLVIRNVGGAGGQRMGIRQGQYLRYGSIDLDTISGSASDSIRQVQTEEDPMGRLLLTMLQQLGVEAEEFAGSGRTLAEMLV